MSLSKKSFVTAVVASFVMAFGLAAANDAHAQEQCLPGTFNPQIGVKAGDCYTTPEMNKALKALGQRSLIAGDRIAFGANANGIYSTTRLNVFTSNPDGTIGLNIEGNAPAGQQSSYFAVRATMSGVRLWDRGNPVLPSADIVGQRNAEGIQKSGDRLMFSAKFGQGVYFVVVARGDDPQIGSFLSANSKNGADLAALENLNYTQVGEELIHQQQDGQRDSMLTPK